MSNITILILAFMLALIASSFIKVEVYDEDSEQELKELTLTQIRYKVDTGSSICIKDKVRNIWMIVYPIDFKSARVKTNMGIDIIHKCRLSVISEVMDIIDEHQVKVYDGLSFLALQK